MTDDSLAVPPSTDDPKQKKKMSKARKIVLIVGIVLASLGLIAAIIAAIVFGGDDNDDPVATKKPTPQPTVTVTSEPPTVGSCVADQLDISISSPEPAENESTVRVIFTNTGSTACSLTGYPRVSFALSPGTQEIGQEALPDPSSLVAAIAIDPAEQAHAVLIVTNTDRVTQCEPQDVDGFSIYPPVPSQAVFVEASGFQSCGDAGGPQLSIGAVQSGD